MKTLGERIARVAEVEMSFLSGKQIVSVLEDMEKLGRLDAVLVTKVCLSIGARWSEAENLRVRQIRNGTIHLTQTKSGKNRAIPINDELERALLNYASARSDRLFGSCYNVFRDAIKRCNIELPKGQLTHVLRHTFSSHFMMNGGNILVLQRILGHSSLAMTMRYAHFAPDHLHEARILNPLVRLTI